MKKHFVLLVIIIVSFLSCTNTKYSDLIEQTNSLCWWNSMEDAEKALDILDRAIEIEPKEWKAYSIELQIYDTWCHKTEERSNNYIALKDVYDRWIINGNTFSFVQLFGYANVLFCLGEREKAKDYYDKMSFSVMNDNSLLLDEQNYVAYILSGIINGLIVKENFSDYKMNAYDENGVNEYLFQIIVNDSQEDIIETYCTT